MNWANNDQIRLPIGQMSDSEQCSNRLQLDLILILVNFSYELWQVITYFHLYDHIWLPIGYTSFSEQCSNLFNLTQFYFSSIFHVDLAQKWPHMTSYRLNKQFWAIFEPTSTLPNFAFGQLLTWIGTYNEWPHMTSYQLNKWFWAIFEPTPTWPNFDFGQFFICELGQIMTR